jgi:hypothetical protein
VTPDQLAKSGSEHGEQRALFAWLAWAELYGFEAAWDDRTYAGTWEPGLVTYAVPELRWCHAIPNGGSRGDDKRSRAIQGGKLKAEGVKPGVLDVFLPVVVRGAVSGAPEPLRCIIYAGLYVEMKRGENEFQRAGVTSSLHDRCTPARLRGCCLFQLATSGRTDTSIYHCA